MPIKMPVNTAGTGTSATKVRVNGKRLILQKILWRSHAKSG